MTDEVEFVTAREGGVWVPWEEWKLLRVPGPGGKRVHAIMYSDGRVWDAQNGFRPPEITARYEIATFHNIWVEFKRAKDRIDQMRQEPEIFGVI